MEMDMRQELVYRCDVPSIGNSELQVLMHDCYENEIGEPSHLVTIRILRDGKSQWWPMDISTFRDMVKAVECKVAESTPPRGR